MTTGLRSTTPSASVATKSLQRCARARHAANKRPHSATKGRHAALHPLRRRRRSACRSPPRSQRRCSRSRRPAAIAQVQPWRPTPSANASPKQATPPLQTPTGAARTQTAQCRRPRRQTGVVRYRRPFRRRREQAGAACSRRRHLSRRAGPHLLFQAEHIKRHTGGLHPPRWRPLPIPAPAHTAARVQGVATCASVAVRASDIHCATPAASLAPSQKMCCFAANPAATIRTGDATRALQGSGDRIHRTAGCGAAARKICSRLCLGLQVCNGKEGAGWGLGMECGSAAQKMLSLTPGALHVS